MKGREEKGREETRMEAKKSERAESESDGAKKEQELDLSGMSLDSLPNPSINLSTITKLDLSNNDLQVSSSCTHRTALHLMKSIGFLSIPESLTARLLNLVVLDVHSNQLRALPNSIGCLSKLKALNVSGNLLESLPKTIEHCR
ncbi:hypothetical protein GW17_00004032 [Ensete ventricosum]|nr:hypothetical protein GW17_00004032 [Ensete ventricosum]